MASFIFSPHIHNLSDRESGAFDFINQVAFKMRSGQVCTLAHESLPTYSNKKQLLLLSPHTDVRIATISKCYPSHFADGQSITTKFKHRREPRMLKYPSCCYTWILYHQNPGLLRTSRIPSHSEPYI